MKRWRHLDSGRVAAAGGELGAGDIIEDFVSEILRNQTMIG